MVYPKLRNLQGLGFDLLFAALLFSVLFLARHELVGEGVRVEFQANPTKNRALVKQQ